MSRTHLYRATRPARPLGSIVLASAWSGAALAMMLTTGPAMMRGVPLHGPSAGLQDRAAVVVAAGAMLVGLLVVVSEMVSGRTVRRGVRLAGAVVLACAGMAGLFDTARRVLRPGTPVAEAAAPEPVVAETAPPLPDDVALVNVARQRLLWTTGGLVGAALVLAGGIGALRSWEPTL